MKQKLRAFIARCTPDAVKVLGVFLVTFAATASPFVPSLAANLNAGKLPSFSSLHAVVVAAVAAGIRACLPVARVIAIKAAYTIVAKVEMKKVEAKIIAAATVPAPAPADYPAPDPAAVAAVPAQ